MDVDNNIFQEELDVTGHKCPVPILRVRRILENMPRNSLLKVMATDPMTQIDFAHFCQQSGHELLSMTEEDSIFYYVIKKIGKV